MHGQMSVFVTLTPSEQQVLCSGMCTKQNQDFHSICNIFLVPLVLSYSCTLCSLCFGTDYWEVGSTVRRLVLCKVLWVWLCAWLTHACINLHSVKQSFTRPLCISVAPTSGDGTCWSANFMCFYMFRSTKQDGNCETAPCPWGPWFDKKIDTSSLHPSLENMWEKSGWVMLRAVIMIDLNTLLGLFCNYRYRQPSIRAVCEVATKYNL